MKRNLSFAALAVLGAFMLVVLSGVPSPYAAHAQSSPSVAVSLSDASVEQGAAITATMSFGDLASDTSTTDYVFRADVLDSEDGDCRRLRGRTAWAPTGTSTRWARTRRPAPGTIFAGCPAGTYTLRVSISSADNTELASASAGFFILRAPESVEPPTLTALGVSHGDPAVEVELSPAFDSGKLEYDADVRVAQVTVAPTASDADATGRLPGRE